MRDVAERHLTVESLMERMNENPSSQAQTHGKISDYVVMFLRMLTSAELEVRKEFFTPWIQEEAIDMGIYRQRRVDPMGEEADQLHITALVDAIGVGCRVEYLDGNGAGDHVDHHDFMPSSQQQQQSEAAPTSAEPPIHLLYRPGHYDILNARID